MEARTHLTKAKGGDIHSVAWKSKLMQECLTKLQQRKRDKLNLLVNHQDLEELINTQANDELDVAERSELLQSLLDYLSDEKKYLENLCVLASENATETECA
jgi:hypothetical protein